jgi:hypothetical protein
MIYILSICILEAVPTSSLLISTHGSKVLLATARVLVVVAAVSTSISSISISSIRVLDLLCPRAQLIPPQYASSFLKVSLGERIMK